MKTFQEYIEWLRNLQPVLDSPELYERLREASKRDLRYYDYISGVPLYPGDDNLMLGCDLNLENVVKELGKFGFELMGGKVGDSFTRERTSWWRSDWKKVNEYGLRHEYGHEGIGNWVGQIWEDPSIVPFTNQPQQTITTPLGLVCEEPSVIIDNSYGQQKPIEGSLRVQTLITPRFRSKFERENQRKIEDLMLNVLEHITREKIPAFYGNYKVGNYIVNM